MLLKYKFYYGSLYKSGHFKQLKLPHVSFALQCTFPWDQMASEGFPDSCTGPV